MVKPLENNLSYQNYRPAEIPDTSYTRFALGDQQVSLINGKFQERAPNPKFKEAGVGNVPQLSNLVPSYRVNPIVFYDREVPYSGRMSTYIRIAPPGERLNIVDRPANEQDYIKYPDEYRAYLDQKPQKPEGTPLTVLGLTQQQINELAEKRIYTVEQGATLSDTAVHELNLTEFQRKCIYYYNYAKSQKLLDEKDEEIARLKQQLAQKREKPRID